MMSMVVNSFPRTANVFFTSILSDYFNGITLDDSLSNMTGTILHDANMLDNANINQIVILRNPSESVVSNQIYVNYTNNTTNYTLEDSANYWLAWHRSVLKNIQHLYPFYFEQITLKTDQCLEQLENTFGLQTYAYQNIDDFLEDLNKKDNIRQTSKSSGEYNKTKEMFFKLDRNTLDQVNDLYEVLCRELLNRQKDLGWTF